MNGPRNAFGSEPATLPVNLWGFKWGEGGRAGWVRPVQGSALFRNVERVRKLNTALGFDGEKTRSESLSDPGVDRG